MATSFINPMLNSEEIPDSLPKWVCHFPLPSAFIPPHLVKVLSNLKQDYLSFYY